MRGANRSRGAILLIAIIAYLPGFWWGTPHATAEDRRKAWAVDDEPPLGPLAQLHDMMTPGVAPDANLGYPMMHSYVVLGAFAPYVGVLMAKGELTRPTAAYPYGFADPVSALRNLSLIAHFVSVLLAAGIVLAAYVAAQSLWGERDARWGAAFALLSYPMFFYARTSNVDVPMLFFAAWSLAIFARTLSLGVTSRRLALFGILAGLAIATKEPVAAIYLGLPVALLVPHGNWKGYRSPAAVARATLITAACVFVAYAIGSGMVLDFERWKGHITFGLTRTTDVAAGDVSFAESYPATLAGHWSLIRVITGRLSATLTPPGLILAASGASLALLWNRRSGWLLLAALSYLLVLFFVVRMAQLRYVMPAAFVLALYAGHAAAVTIHSGHRVMRLAGVATTAAAVAIATLWAVDLTYAMVRDSRYAAGRWIASVGRPGDRLEYFGAFQKNPPLPSWLQSGLAVEYLGGVQDAPRDDATAQRILSGFAERRPRFVILTPDHTSRPGEPYAHSCPPRVFTALEAGTAGYVQARLFETPQLIGFLPRPRLDYGQVNPPIRVYVAPDDSVALRGNE
jgi:4-amino-4-deoxy-L-arabinose transferase-like glycosyltransferase